MHVDQMFPSPYIKAADVLGRELNITIAGWEYEEFEDPRTKEKDRKPVLSFQKTDKRLILNVTNAKTIASIFGEETDNWAGKQICLFTKDVEAFGEMKNAIRIKAPVDNQAAPVQPPPPPPPSADADDPFDNAPHPDSTGADSLPF